MCHIHDPSCDMCQRLAVNTLLPTSLSFLPNKIVISMVVVEKLRRDGEEGRKMGDNCALIKDINYS